MKIVIRIGQTVHFSSNGYLKKGQVTQVEDDGVWVSVGGVSTWVPEGDILTAY
jgi:ribosomal protein S1